MIWKLFFLVFLSAVHIESKLENELTIMTSWPHLNPEPAASPHARLQLKQIAIDTWSIKELLGLASAVLRSGDQNWVSVSRQMKPFAEALRPSDWFSQKNCALQYNLLLEKAEQQVWSILPPQLSSPIKDDTLPCKCQALAWKNEPKAWIQGFLALKIFLVA